MTQIIRSQDAQEEIDEIAKYTKQRWGELQAAKYIELIERAERIIASNPKYGKIYDSRRPDILSYRIDQASHIFFYKVASHGVIKILHILHERRDLDQYFR